VTQCYVKSVWCYKIRPDRNNVTIVKKTTNTRNIYQK